MRYGRALAILSVIALTSCDQPLIKQPPKQYRADNTAAVSFVASPDATCRQIGGEAEGTIVGCHRAGVIVLPNPCTWPNRSDYADIACHELGHRDGWPGNHPD